jgi:hypothetical protein
MSLQLSTKEKRRTVVALVSAGLISAVIWTLIVILHVQ